ncbi:MAG: DsbA family protein [Candidatus Magasanikbacteria bacterium]|nr:DsbA family protein [Candidatus Magasanikbacteria bacterium]
MDNKQGNGSIFESLSPGKVFASGLVIGILVLCTIGFFILLGVYVNGDNAKVDVNNNRNQQVGTEDVGNKKIAIRSVTKKDHIRGDKNAKVTIVEYSDLECPFCKRFHNTMLEVMDKFDGDVKWVFRHFPLDSLHRQARAEANASECAGEQDKFWEFIDLINEVTPSNDGLDLDKLPEYAQQVGVKNISKFTECVESGKYDNKVNDDFLDGQKAGIRGTPYSVAIGPNGEMVEISGAQPFSSLEQTINSLLK